MSDRARPDRGGDYPRRVKFIGPDAQANAGWILRKLRAGLALLKDGRANEFGDVVGAREEVAGPSLSAMFWRHARSLA